VGGDYQPTKELKMKTATMMRSKSLAPKLSQKSQRRYSIVREGVVAGTLSGAVAAL
jgi:hypothetical protein